MTRLDENWTAVNEVEHWGWKSFEYAMNKWLAALPAYDEAYDMDISDQCFLFIEAHPDGWEMHPNTPCGLDGTQVRDLRLEPAR